MDQEFVQDVSYWDRAKRLVLGKAHDPHDSRLFHNLSLIAFFAWVGLGADGLSSSCYGPQEAFLALGSHIYLSLFVALASAFTIFIISASYSQTIELFPAVAAAIWSPANCFPWSWAWFPVARC